ncbi:MAG: GNAT family N-acetyltransferase [Victivallales bacterium]|jgi:RimJ/RimL family protein N-acetyltransferase
MITLTAALKEFIREFGRRRGHDEPANLVIAADNCWNLKISCDLTGLPGLCIRSLQDGDLPLLQEFGAKLGPASKDLFCPYPWNDPETLPAAFQKAIQNSRARIDASYLIESAGHGVIGHFFLWKAGGNPHSREYQVEVPELGVAIADGFQGKGLGWLSVRILQAVATDLHADAIELTTAFANDAGWKTYQRCGFQHIGDINTPLGVDVTAALTDGVTASSYRVERQMLYMISEENRERVLSYLETKRKTAPA